MTATWSPAAGDDQRRGRRRRDVEDRPALAGRGQKLVVADDESVAVARRDEPLRAWPVSPDGDDRGALVDVGHEADRLPLPSSARQFGGVEREHLAVARQHQNLRGRFGEK